MTKDSASQHRGFCRGALLKPAALQHCLAPASRKAAGFLQKAKFQAGLQAWQYPALNTTILIAFHLQLPALPAAMLGNDHPLG